MRLFQGNLMRLFVPQKFNKGKKSISLFTEKLVYHKGPIIPIEAVRGQIFWGMGAEVRGQSPPVK